MSVPKKTNSSKLGALMIIVLIAAAIGLVYALQTGLGVTFPFPQTSLSPTPTNIPLSSPISTVTSTSTFTPIQTTDLNWGGYMVASDLTNPQPTVKGITATWFVPSVTVSMSDTFSAIWIGIGGSFDNSLIQIGSEQDSISGQAVYSAWYEMLPDFSITIDNLIVSPGDQMKASITLVDSNTNQWSLFLEDMSTGKQFQTNVNYASSQLSAEYVIERPTINNAVSGLAAFGSVIFSDCGVTLGSESGGIDNFPCAKITMYQHISFSREVVQLVNVSNLSKNGTSFTLNYIGT